MRLPPRIEPVLSSTSSASTALGSVSDACAWASAKKVSVGMPTSRKRAVLIVPEAVTSAVTTSSTSETSTSSSVRVEPR